MMVLSRTISFSVRECLKSGSMFLIALIIQLPLLIAGWGSNDDDTSEYAMYGMSMQRDWLYDSTSIAIKYEGCVWSYVDDRENMGCMDDESEDGTSYWYMMANCKRAQVAYSVYATSSGTTSCNSKDFKESMMTTSGVAEFAYTMGSYSYNAPISSNDVGSLPICEEDGNGYYMSVGCSSSGAFTIDRFTDVYCLQYYDTYDYLSNFNSAMKSNNLNKCYNAYSDGTDESPYASLSAYLIPYSGSCSATESAFCTTSDFVKKAGSSSGFQSSGHYKSGENLSLTNKLKYGLGGTMLVGSLVMFFGILFTNRRKRRALMHRKFRSGPSTSRSRSKKPGAGAGAGASASSGARSKRKKRSGSAGKGASTSRGKESGVMA